MDVTTTSEAPVEGRSLGELNPEQLFACSYTAARMAPRAGTLILGSKAHLLHFLHSSGYLSYTSCECVPPLPREFQQEWFDRHSINAGIVAEETATELRKLWGTIRRVWEGTVGFKFGHELRVRPATQAGSASGSLPVRRRASRWRTGNLTRKHQVVQASEPDSEGKVCFIAWSRNLRLLILLGVVTSG